MYLLVGLSGMKDLDEQHAAAGQKVDSIFFVLVKSHMHPSAW